MFDSFSRIGINDILSIPIPHELDDEIVNQISTISKDLNESKYHYDDKKKQLNDLINDLYELSFWEKKRIDDYFLPKTRVGKNSKILNSYLSTLNDVIGFYLKNPVSIELSSTEFNLFVAKISLIDNPLNPKGEKAKKYILNEIFQQNSNDSFLAGQEKIWGKDCVYIIKENINTNWTETKAYEDGQDILRHLITDRNGERIY
jgi:hypothetical protein